jgi:hypothetical protein
MQRLPFPLVFALLATEAQACTPPPPPLQLRGEPDRDFVARASAFNEARRDEDGRRQQVGWFDAATTVSLARITSAHRLPQVLSDGLSLTRRVEAVPLATFKGDILPGRTVAMQDVVATTCGIFGGGTATAAQPGDYVVTFENVQPDGTGHVGLLLRDLREPRILERFDEVVQRARSVARRP